MKKLSEMNLGELAAFYFWDDLQSLEQAKLVSLMNSIDFKEVKRWSKTQNEIEKLNKFMEFLKK